MTDQELFTQVGIREEKASAAAVKSKRSLPIFSIAVLVLIILGCLLADVIATKDPAYLDLMNYTKAPNGEFLFGTDTLGRDIFSCIWHGGRVSLFIGFFATLISTTIAVVYGSISGISSDWVDTAMMRVTEIFLSVPGLLVILFIQAILGDATVVS
ncbi:MAG: hypothetical protein MJY75_07065, partial [Bacteroidaceae bacterium]|nr:hypothetical protein [Bacteroidaceae bacterium]